MELNYEKAIVSCAECGALYEVMYLAFDFLDDLDPEISYEDIEEFAVCTDCGHQVPRNRLYCNESGVWEFQKRKSSSPPPRGMEIELETKILMDRASLHDLEWGVTRKLVEQFLTDRNDLMERARTDEMAQFLLDSDWIKYSMPLVTLRDRLDWDWILRSHDKTKRLEKGPEEK